jgi:chemotaxis protein CheD
MFLSQRPSRLFTWTEHMQPPSAPPGFEHINRYYDAVNQRYAAKLLPGQFYLSRDEAIVTVVGTCVAVCLRDRVLGLGGMNHFMEPYATTGAAASPAEDAMFTLYRALLDAGAHRPNLEAKLYGGARILTADCPIGDRTIAYAQLFLRQAGIPIVEEDVGGHYPRKIDFQPQDGRVRLKHLRDLHNNTVADRDRQFLEGYRRPPRSADLGDESRAAAVQDGAIENQSEGRSTR